MVGPPAGGVPAAVSSYDDEAAAIAGGLERVAEAVGAEIGAVVRGGEVVAAVGFPSGRVPVDELCRADGKAGAIDVPGAGRCPALSLSLAASPPSFLVVARSGGGFQDHDKALLEAMARVLGLGLRMLRTLEAERASPAWWPPSRSARP